MENLPTKYLLIWGLAGIVILTLAGLLLYSLMPGSKPLPQPESKPGTPARVLPQTQAEKPVRSVSDLEANPKNPSELTFLLPATDEDGTPFVLTDASERANLGFKALKEKRFQDAVSEYRMATELDPRYEPTLKRTEALVEEIRRNGFEKAKNMRVFPGDRLTYKQLYNWE